MWSLGLNHSDQYHSRSYSEAESFFSVVLQQHCTYPYMSKSRREQFESQLRSLQDDISSLSRRLGNPVSAATTKSDPKLETARTMPPDTKNPAKYKGDKSRLAKEKRSVERERDDLLFRVEQLNGENTELRDSAAEIQRVKSLYEHLKQDHDSLLLSLQSSERIRRQQKELIQILQKSTISNGLSADSTFSLSVHGQEDCVTSHGEHSQSARSSPRYEVFGTGNFIENTSTIAEAAPELSNSRSALASSSGSERRPQKKPGHIYRGKVKSKTVHGTVKAGVSVKNNPKGLEETTRRPIQRRPGTTSAVKSVPNSQRKRDTVHDHRKNATNKRNT